MSELKVVSWDPEEEYEGVYEDVDAAHEMLNDAPVSGMALAEAENHARAIKFHRERIEAIEAHAASEIHRIEAWKAQQLEGINKKIWWHETSVFNWFKSLDKATEKLINGTLKRTKGRERIEVDENMANVDKVFIVEKVTYSVDKKAVMAHVKSTGEIPDGVDIVRGEDSYKIVT